MKPKTPVEWIKEWAENRYSLLYVGYLWSRTKELLRLVRLWIILTLANCR
jgi:hypothetical protein